MKRMQFWFTVLLIVLLTLVCSQALADPVTFNVSTTAEWTDAINKINSNPAQEYIINLTADLDNAPAFIVNKDGAVVTILGHDHTITLSVPDISIGADAGTVNLGKADGTDTLTITSNARNDCPGAISITNGTVNMYDGVTIRDVKNNSYFGGGVTIGGQYSVAATGTFHMYGGTIRNCGVGSGSVCYGGGVSVLNGGKFIMDGGTITECYATTSYPTSWQTPSGAVGGVFVSGSGSFIMNGGTISDCTAQLDGGGVAVVTSSKAYHTNPSGAKGYGWLDGYFEMNGGTISGCSAELGAGIFGGGGYCSVRTICAPNPEMLASQRGIIINGGTISGNQATGGGAGIFLNWIRPQITVNIHNALITGNKAPEGAGVYIMDDWTQADIADCTISGNTATAGVGGGLLSSGNTSSSGTTGTTVRNSAIVNNLASIEGSDVYVGSSSIVKLCAADAKAPVYLGLPADVTNKPVTGWYEDYATDAATNTKRYVNQDPTERVEKTGYATLTTDDSSYFALIAAPAITNHIVSFDLQGKGTLPDEEVEDGEKATEPDPAPTADGFVFGGWYTEPECTNLYNFDTPVTADITLYAQWIPLMTVTFDVQGHGVAPAPQVIPSGSVATEPAAPTADGFRFGGWYTEAACTNLYDFSTPVTANMTLFAKWTAQVSVEKVWILSINGGNYQPASIKVQLYNGVTPVGTPVEISEDADGDWRYTWPDELPVDGTYTVKEIMEGDMDKHYTAIVEEVTKNSFKIANVANEELKVTITNTHNPYEVDVTLNKTWNDDDNTQRPDVIHVVVSFVAPNGVTKYIAADGTEHDTEVTIDLTAPTWTATIEDLFKNQNHGQMIVYTVEEKSINGYKGVITYTQDANGNWTFSIVNTLTGKTDILGTKVWDDDNDRDGIRPGSITLNVYRNTVDPANLAAGPITVTYPAGDQYANNWAWTVEDLPTYDKNGDPITYVVVEDPVPGYDAPVVVYVPVTP